MNNCKELLAVLAAGSVLVLLLCALTPAQTAKSAVCKDHLHLLHQAALFYEAQWDGGIVPVKTTHQRHLVCWMDLLLPYLDDCSAYYCPEDPKGAMALEKVDLLPVVYRAGSTSYGMNYYLGSVGKSRPSDRQIYNRKYVNTPASVVFFGDSRTYWLRANKSCWKLDWAGRHGGSDNYVMVDGHVEMLGPQTLGLSSRPENWNDWKLDSKRWSDWKSGSQRPSLKKKRNKK